MGQHILPLHKHTLLTPPPVRPSSRRLPLQVPPPSCPVPPPRPSLSTFGYAGFPRAESHRGSARTASERDPVASPNPGSFASYLVEKLKNRTGTLFRICLAPSPLKKLGCRCSGAITLTLFLERIVSSRLRSEGTYTRLSLSMGSSPPPLCSSTCNTLKHRRPLLRPFSGIHPLTPAHISSPVFPGSIALSSDFRLARWLTSLAAWPTPTSPLPLSPI